MNKTEAIRAVCPQCDWVTLEPSERVARFVMDLHQSVVHPQLLPDVRGETA